MNKQKQFRYITQDREAGNFIDSFSTLIDAENAIKQYESDDMQENIFTEDFYEIKRVEQE